MTEMSDLPERIWSYAITREAKFVDGVFVEGEIHDGVWYDKKHNDHGVEYLRADLAPVIGYSREQVRLAYMTGDDDAVCHEGGGGRFPKQLEQECERFFATLTPTSSVSVPTIDELAEAVYQDNTALLTNVEALYIARVVHALLTKGRGGV
jgi:hypothetical protein